MKKLLFTTIAVLAFSGVSFAKTGEVKILLQSKKVLTQCGDVYHATYIAAKANGANDKQAGATAFAAHKSCLGIQ